MDSNNLNMLFTTLNAARIMMKNRDRQPHEEAIYTALQHCQDEVFPRLKADLARARKALEPFNQFPDWAERKDSDMTGMRITYRELRAAHAALAVLAH